VPACCGRPRCSRAPWKLGGALAVARHARRAVDDRPALRLDSHPRGLPAKRRPLRDGNA
jgi:hypothetical protein